MPPLPVLVADEVMRVLERHGFERARQKGSHVRMKHADGRATVVPQHGKRPLKRGLLRSIIRQSGLSVDDFV
ncbi:MAG: type II toxin-antitoxin system HicA family toxin [Thermoleophilia bacterium]|nr:type II toxin-antitoxin system HicA family toxin [Thermoleophilia bacterium]